MIEQEISPKGQSRDAKTAVEIAKNTVADLFAQEGVVNLGPGVTDAVFLITAADDTRLLTTDLDLYLEASRLGQTAINFNHHIKANRH